MPNTPSRVEGPERSIVAGACRGRHRGGAVRGALTRAHALRCCACCCAAVCGPPGAASASQPPVRCASHKVTFNCPPPPPPGFVGELEGELTVELGDKVKVHSEVDGWARVIRLSDNRTGLVPSWAVSLE